MSLSGQEKNDYQNAWMARRRADGIEMLGGRCVVCGTTERLEVDHIDRSTKTSHRIWSWSWQRIVVELAKCQLLCHQHHFEKTLSDFPASLASRARERVDRYEVFQ